MFEVCSICTFSMSRLISLSSFIRSIFCRCNFCSYRRSASCITFLFISNAARLAASGLSFTLVSWILFSSASDLRFSWYSCYSFTLLFRSSIIWLFLSFLITSYFAANSSSDLNGKKSLAFFAAAYSFIYYWRFSSIYYCKAD